MPGDVLLERRNWFMSNIGIPGFWPHVAFFIGTFEDIDRTFSGIDMLGGKVPSDYLKENFPRPLRVYGSTGRVWFFKKRY